MSLFGVDTETFLIRPGRATPQLVVTSFYDESADNAWLLHGVSDREDTLTTLQAILEGHEMVGHNIAYDLSIWANEFPELLPTIFKALGEGRIHCTMLAQQIQFLAHGKYRFDEAAGRAPLWSLAYTAKDILAVEIDKSNSPRLHYSELIDTPIEDWSPEEVEYATVDAILPVKIYREQQNCPPTDLAPVVKDGTIVNLKEQVAFSFAIRLMSTQGMRTDPNSVALLKLSLKGEVDAAMALLASSNVPFVGLLDWEPLVRESGTRNMKAIKKRVVQAYEGVPPLTDKGLEVQDAARDSDQWDELKGSPEFWEKYASTNSATLIASGDEALELLGNVLSSMSELNNFLPILERGTIYPVTPNYRTLQVTGRTSCARPNMQNLPRRKGVRECFVARPGYTLLFCDYDSLEIRTFAQTCLDVVGRSTFAENYAKDKHWDPHSWVGSAIVGISYEDFLIRLGEGDHECAEARRMAKVVNFGIPGGMGWRTMIEYAPAYGVTLSEDQARYLHGLWKDLCSEAVEYFEMVGSATGDWGHKIHQCLRSGRQRGRCNYTQFSNNGFQGPAADLAKDATVRVVEESYTKKDSALYTCRPLQFIHDELIVECPDERVSWAGPRLAEVMVEVGLDWCPDVPLTAETAAAKFWSKDVKPTYNEHGLLIAWTP